MSDVTQIAFQLDNENLAAIDALSERESRSRAEVLRTAVGEFLARRREREIDAQLAAGYEKCPPGPGEDALADRSVEGLEAADLEW